MRFEPDSLMVGDKLACHCCEAGGDINHNGRQGLNYICSLISAVRSIDVTYKLVVIPCLLDYKLFIKTLLPFCDLNKKRLERGHRWRAVDNTHKDLNVNVDVMALISQSTCYVFRPLFFSAIQSF